MSIRISNPGKAAVIGTALSWLIATVANAGNAYLPVTGPTPLRLEVAMTKFFDFSSVGKVVAPPPKPDTETKVMDPAPAATNAMITTVSPPEPGNLTATTEEPPLPPAPVPPHPADNLLVITPQMLAEYFKPMSNATNGAGVSVFVPVQVGFTPPTEKNPPSSRATYKVQ